MIAKVVYLSMRICIQITDLYTKITDSRKVKHMPVIKVVILGS
jgi:hypothetical protein